MVWPDQIGLAFGSGSFVGVSQRDTCCQESHLSCQSYLESFSLLVQEWTQGLWIEAELAEPFVDGLLLDPPGLLRHHDAAIGERTTAALEASVRQCEPVSCSAHEE